MIDMRIPFDSWLVVAIVIVAVFLVAGAGLWLGSIDPSTRDLGRDLFVEAIFLGLTVFVIERMLGRAERGRWKKLRVTVLEMLSDEISAIESNIAFMLLPLVEIGNTKLSAEEIVEKVNRDTQKGLEELAAAGSGKIMMAVNRLIGHPSIRYFGPLFKNHAEKLGVFVDRYSAHLDPDLQAHLVTLEHSLGVASSSIDMADKFVVSERSIDTDRPAKSVAGIAAWNLGYSLYRAIKSIERIRALGILDIRLHRPQKML